MAETIDEFLVDFYKTKNNEDITVDKIQEIKTTYGDDYDKLIVDLYNKYDNGVEEEKITQIKSTYELGNGEKDLTTQLDERAKKLFGGEVKLPGIGTRQSGLSSAFQDMQLPESEQQEIQKIAEAESLLTKSQLENKKAKSEFETTQQQAIVNLEDEYKKKSIDYGKGGDEIAPEIYGEFLEKKKELSYEDELQAQIDIIGVDAKNDYQLNKIKKAVLDGKLSKAEARMNLIDIGRKDQLNLPMFKIEGKQDDGAGYETVAYDGPDYVGGTVIGDLGTYLIDAAFKPNLIEGDAKPDEQVVKFKGVVRPDGKLVNWNNYYAGKPMVGREAEQILEQYPGSYMINTVEDLERYAEKNNLTHQEALDKINESARSFNAHQKLAEQEAWENQPRTPTKGKKPLLDASEKDQIAIEEGVLKQLVDSRITQAVTELPNAITSGEYKNYLGDLVKNFSEEDIKRAEVRSKGEIDVDISEYGLGDFEEDTKTEQVLKDVDKSVEELKEYFKDEEGTSKVQSYINKYVNQGLDVVEGWTEEQIDNMTPTEQEVAQAMVKLQKASLDTNTSREDLQTLWNNYNGLWEAWDKNGVERLYDANTGEYLFEEDASEEIKEDNRIINASAAQLKGLAFDDIKALRRRAFFELQSSMEYVMQEDMYGTWSQSGLIDWLKKSGYQDLDIKDGKIKSMPKNLLKIPNESTPGFRRYNQALVEWQIANKAFMLNMDPVTLSRDKYGAAFGQGMAQFFGDKSTITNDDLSRAYVDLVKEQGGQLNPLAEERIAEGTSDYWRAAGNISAFALSFGLIRKGVKNNKAYKGYDEMVKTSLKSANNRFTKFAFGTATNSVRDIALGVSFDKIMKQINLDHQEFGADMWGYMGAGGFIASYFMKGLQGLTKIAPESGAAAYKNFTRQMNNAAVRLTQPAIDNPLYLKLQPALKVGTQTAVGVGTSTLTMLTSETLAAKMNEDRTWGEAVDIGYGFDMKDPYTDEDLPWYNKLVHTAAMMLAGHMSHAAPYQQVTSALKSVAKNWKQPKNIKRSYDLLGTSEADVKNAFENGTDNLFFDDLKRNKLKESGAGFKEISQRELTDIDNAIETLKESGSMELFKEEMKKIEFQESNDKNVDGKLLLLQNRLLNNLSEGKPLSYEDAKFLSELPPSYKEYLSNQIASNNNFQGENAWRLKLQLENGSDVVKEIRNNVDNKVYKNNTEVRDIYNKVTEYRELTKEVKNLEEQLKPANIENNIIQKPYLEKQLETKLERQKKLGEEVEKISSGERLQEKDIAYAEKLGKDLGIEPEILGTEEAYEAAMKEAGFEGEGTEAAFFYDKGSGRILINKARAKRVGAFTAATHDMLHPLTDRKMKTISVEEVMKADPKLTEAEARGYIETHNVEAKRFVNEFKKALSEKELQIIEERLERDYKYIEEKELKNYNIEEVVVDKEGKPIVEDGKIELKEEAYQHEYPTALKDAISDNLITYNESTAKKLGDVFKSAWKGIFPKAEWKSGEDVYEFVKTYAKGTKKGIVPLEVKRKAREYKKSQKPEVSKMAASRTQEITKELKELVPEWKKAEGPEKVKLQDRMKTLTAEKKSLEQATNRRVRDFQNISKRFNTVDSKGKEKIINELVEKDGERLTNAEWKEFLYTNLKDHGGEGLVLDKIADMFESAIEGKIKGKVVTSNERSVSRSEAMEILRDELTSRKFQWEKIVDFDPKVNKSFSGYMNSIIHNAYKSTLEKIGKKPKTTKSIDETYEGGRRITEVESKELSPEELADISLAKEAKEKAKKLEEEKLIKEGAAARDVEKAAGRSTMKTTIDLTKTEQSEVKEFVESELKEEVKDLEKGDFSFFEKPKFRNKAVKKFAKEFLERIPHPSSESAKAEKKAIDELVKKGEISKQAAEELKQEVNKRLKNEYKTWLEKVLYPEIVDLNKPISEGGDPGIFRRMNWDILYEATGKKYTAAEAKKLQVEQGIKSVTSQRAEYKEKTPTAEDFADFIMHEGKYKNAKSRPNEKRLRIGSFLAEKIVSDALVDVVATSKNVPEFTKSEILRERSLSKLSEILKKDPNISFHKTAEKKVEPIDKNKLEGIANKPIGTFAKSTQALFKDLKIEPLKFITERGVEIAETNRVMENFIENILPKYLPIRKIMSSGGLANYGEIGIGSPLKGSTREIAVRKGRGNEVHNLSKENVKKVSQMATGLGKPWDKIIKENNKKYLESKEFQKELKDNYDGFDLVIDGLDKMLKAEKYNPEVIQAMEAFFRHSSNASNHPFRMASHARGYEIHWKGKRGPEREHVIPANQLGEIVFRTILDPKASTTMLKKLVRDNYFQVLINKVNDGKVAAIGYKSKMPEGFWESWQEAIRSGDINKAWSSWSRYFNEKVNSQMGFINGKETFGINPNDIIIVNKKGRLESLADQLLIGKKEFGRDVLNPEIIAKQQELISKWATKQEGFTKLEQLRERLAIELDMLNAKRDASLKTMEIIAEVKNPIFSTPERMPNKMLIEKANTFDKALANGRKMEKETKKARVFDFDDTLARTKSNVWYEMPNGKKGKLTAEEFAKRSEQLTAEGAKFDFKEFSKVMEGEKGPLFELAKMIKESKGERDMFVLTARPAEAAKPIHEFLKELGLDIPIENIVGLGNGAPSAKAEWMVEKAAEGFNDFYFADDHGANVEAVDRALKDLEVKSKVQQAKPRPSFSMNTKRDLNWKKDGNDFKTNFKLKGNTYNIRLQEEFYPAKGVYELDFGLEGDRKGMLGKIGITKTGNAAEVFSIVSNGVLDFVRTNKVNEITFSAIEPSRSRLYSTLTKFWANKLGWGHEADINLDGSGRFTIGKNVKDIESFENQSRPEKEVLNTIDKKSKLQRARASFSKNVDKEFNELVEESTGVEWYKEFSPAKAKVKGKDKIKIFLPPSAEDFRGLIYPTLGKGKIGERHLKWYDKHLFKPYARAIENLSTDRVNLMKDFKGLKKQLNVPKDLRQTTKSGFTKEHAVRVYLWNKLGMEIPGLSKFDLKELTDIIEKDSKLQAFGDQILEITKGDGYVKPGNEWVSGTITSDLINLLNTTKRGKYLKDWEQNVNLIYSSKNLNKLESIYGKKYREALEGTLDRMKAGKNRIQSGNRLSDNVLNYINQSQGAIMFFNTRSAVLQTISAANYINWSFNNPIKAGKAFANQPQYWKDFLNIMNSDYLVDRRQGLKLNIAESEIADAAKTSKNKAKAVLNYLLEKGYKPTQIADSFAIATGGATFYRNKIKELMKNDSTLKLEEAERIAFQEFRDISEISQQSSDPSKISQQQASDLGRVVLQFVNTPMQYARIQKRSFQDLVNNRGDAKTNISKILYYGVMQNLWFNFMQQGAFMMGFGDGVDTEEEEKRMFGVFNGMADSILRGIGLAGMTISVLKNVGIDIYEESQKDKPEYSGVWEGFLAFSPGLKSKLTKFKQAGWVFDSKKRRQEIFDKGFSLDNPAFRAGAKVIEGATGLPLDRLYQKYENLSEALDAETETWESAAMIMGWPGWQIRSEQDKLDRRAKEDPSLYNKDEQVNILQQHGLSDEEIKKLNKQEKRTKAILELQSKNNKVYKPPKELKKFTQMKKDTDKEQQEKMLLDLGYSKNEIKKLKYEDARVNAILEAKSGKKKKKSTSIWDDNQEESVWKNEKKEESVFK